MAKQEEKRPGQCEYCTGESDAYCENCDAQLCWDHADTWSYEDVYVCADKEGCERRCGERTVAGQGPSNTATTEERS